MTYEQFYGKYYGTLKEAEKILKDLVTEFQKDNDKIAYVSSRIKNPESMKKKLEKKGIEATAKNALREVNDAVGIRVICSFVDDIYKISEWLQTQNTIEVVNIKNYIDYPKENGYRSYHMIVKILELDFNAEIQIRTIAQDFWANLEHQMKYKRHIKNEQMIRSELKRCSDEIASVDLSMQTIKDLIYSE